MFCFERDPRRSASPCIGRKQIYISTTSACSSRKKWLAAPYMPCMCRELATSAVRISLDESNTMAEIEQFMIVFNQLYQKFSRVN